MNQCLITGCDLIVEAEGKMLHGDLHRVNDQTLVFNGVLADNGEAAWEYDLIGKLIQRPALVIRAHGDYFERRGVLVVSKDVCLLNPAATAYLKGKF